MGIYEAAWAGWECLDESRKDFHGSREAAPLVSLQFEMNMLPVKWEVMRSLEFWIRVIKLGDGKIVKKVVREAIKVGGRVKVGERPDDRFGEVWTQKPLNE